MLSRYKIHRGRRPADDPLPEGVRQDTRKHTRHCLRPEREIVTRYLANPTDQQWRRFRQQYLRRLRQRFAADRAPFDALADHARRTAVHLGCSCPTAKNPDPGRCHTILALAFMQQQYPDLEVAYPPGVEPPALD